MDVANSVILRFDATRSIDRFAEPEQMGAFPKAAEKFSAERALFGDLAPVEPENHAPFIVLREAIDRYFRARVLGGDTQKLLADFLEATAAILRRAEKNSLEAATAYSALRLLADEEVSRMKICGSCGWLFMDRSKNRSRTWCDMAVCGNRVKANRHYHRRKKEAAS
ncbi:Conserved protein containing a Zn-ribbon-like motif [Neorhizobium galegae bv. officinalis]|nr:Conserved protein containing a Zn-ribbon-like motif [Neorhizobium galegae bv. officinalis]